MWEEMSGEEDRRFLLQARKIMRKEIDIVVEKAYLIIKRLIGEIASRLNVLNEKQDIPLLGSSHRIPI